jgi:tetratricopeptide (TPR) repeat protein
MLRACYLLRLGRLGEVLQHAEEVDSLLPNPPLGLLLKAIVYRYTSFFDDPKARESLQQARERAHDHPAVSLITAVLPNLMFDERATQTWPAEGFAFSYQTTFEQQLAAFDRCVNAAPDWVLPRLLRARLRLLRGDLQGARKDLEPQPIPAALTAYVADLRKTLEASPEPTWVLFGRGQMALERGDVETSASCWRTLHLREAERPGSLEEYLVLPLSCYFLGWTATLQGHTAEAIAAFQVFFGAGHPVDIVMAAPWSKPLHDLPDFKLLVSQYQPPPESPQPEEPPRE